MGNTKAAAKKAATKKVPVKAPAKKKASPVEKSNQVATTSFVTPETKFENVLLKDIVADPNQPRHYFNEHDLDELTESVRENGVLQPILIRPSKGGKYMIVCGERRYRASLSVAAVFKIRNSIPAIIRDMTDEEALEAQIIENLQRKDVQPMEEAVAFQSLVEKKKMDVKEIALRVGKSATYVAFRIQLNYLIPDFQEMLSRGMTDLQSAMHLSRLNDEAQEMILKERTQYEKNWKNKNDYRLGNISHYINRGSANLSNANFKISDKDIYPEVGPCTSCPHNTANKPLLFEDMKGKHCTNIACFSIKTDRAYKLKVDQVVSDPEIIPILDRWYQSTDANKAKIEAFKSVGANPLSYAEYDIAELPKEPEHPGTLEEYKVEREFEEGEDDIEELMEDYKDDISDYENELESYKAKLELYNESKLNGFKKGFFVCGSSEGKIVDIILTETSKTTTSSDTTSEIARINTREERNKELDQQKIHTRVQDAVKTFDPFKEDNNDLSGATLTAALLFVFETIPMHVQKNLCEEFKIPSYDYNLSQAYNYFTTVDEPAKLLNRLIRNAISCKLTDMNEASPDKNGKACAVHFLAKQIIPDQVAIFEQEQQEVADKRIINVNKRIAALERKAEKESLSEA
ncbi:MAG: ParB/RepB/Spo0J family partition protein [Taibaiella sp.]|jgi:ParB family chromosome partitioning protein